MTILAGYPKTTHLSILIILAAAAVTHLPFFLLVGVPLVSPDTFTYYWFADRMVEGAVPVTDAPIDLPVGFPTYMFICTMLGLNAVWMVALQTLIFTGCCLYLVLTFHGLGKGVGPLAAMAMACYMILPQTIRANLFLGTESLYTSANMLAVAFSARFMLDGRARYFAGICIAVILAMFMRSNGILLLFLPVLLMGLQWRSGKSVWKLGALLLMVLLMSSAANLLLKDRFAPGELDRIAKVAGRLVSPRDHGNSTIPANAVIPNARLDMYSRYLTTPYTEQPSFYYSILPVNVHRTVVKGYWLGPDAVFFDRIPMIDAAPDLPQRLFNGIDAKAPMVNKRLQLMEHDHRPRCWGFYLPHVVYAIWHRLHLGLVASMLFMVVMIICVRQFIRNRTSHWPVILVVAGAVHILPVMLMPFLHGRFQLRYVHVTEFCVYLAAFCGLPMIIQLFRTRNEADHAS